MMKKFEIMQELLTCDMETQVSKHFWKNGTDRLALHSAIFPIAFAHFMSLCHILW